MAETKDAGLTARLDRIKTLTDELAAVQGETRTALDLADRIKREIDAMRAEARTIDTHPPKSR
jgi:hypothetical protein